MPYVPAIFAPPPPLLGAPSACFWQEPVQAIELCGGTPLLDPGFWDAFARLDNFYIAAPGVAPVVYREEYDAPPTSGTRRAQIYGENLVVQLQLPGFSSHYSGDFQTITVFKCDPETGDVLATYPIDDVPWTGVSEYALTGMPTIDPAFAWYATLFVTLTHDTDSGLDVIGTMYAGVLTEHTMVLHSIDGWTAGDATMPLSTPIQYFSSFTFDSSVVGVHLGTVPPEALNEFGELDNTITHTASVTIDGTLYTITFSAAGAG